MDKKAPFNNPFAALKEKLGPLPAGPVTEPSREPVAAAPPKWNRAVVRREKKGHGGKEMTRISQLTEDAATARELLEKMKRQLGCGGVNEGLDILLQGDQRERVKALLVALGVKRVTVGL